MLPKILHYTLNLRPDNAVRMRSGYYPVSSVATRASSLQMCSLTAGKLWFSKV